MRPPRVTIRLLTAIIAAVALLLGAARWAWNRYPVIARPAGGYSYPIGTTEYWIYQIWSDGTITHFRYDGFHLQRLYKYPFVTVEEGSEVSKTNPRLNVRVRRYRYSLQIP